MTGLKAVLALDIGTTATKCAVIDAAGRTLAAASSSYGTMTDRDRVEQNPEDWWNAALESAAATMNSLERSGGSRVPVAAVVSSGQMQDCIPVARGESIAPAILYSDYRASELLPELFRLIPEKTLRTATGNLPDGAGLPAKILWYRTYAPEILDRAEGILFGAHDYILYKMTGRRRTDFTTASTTGLLELRVNRWFPDLVEALGIRPDLLPELAPLGETAGTVGEQFSRAAGIPAGTPLFQGCGDLGAGAIGSGSVNPQTPSVYLGTSGWVLTTMYGEPVDPETGVFNLRFPTGDRIIQVGPMLTAGGNADWAAGILGRGSDGSNPDDSDTRNFEDLTREAENIPPGSGGVLYLPYPAGERAPFRDPAARACFIGIDRGTTRGRLFRAVLEGVAFSLRSLVELTSGTAGANNPGSPGTPGASRSPGVGAARTLVLAGGGAASTLWPRIIADVVPSLVKVPEGQDEVGVRGIAGAVLQALGELPAGSDGVLPARLKAEFSPDSSATALYEPYYAVFRTLYPALKPAFADLAKVR